MAFAFALVVHNNLAGNIAKNGSDAQQAAHLPDLIAAKRIGAFLLTERKGGSDAAAIATRARETEDGWRITGEKAWVSNGTHADLLSVYANTDPAAGWRGIACFLVDGAAPGIERQPGYAVLGGYALGANGFEFHDAPVMDDGVLLGPGDGFKAAMAGIDIARINVAFMCCGMMRAALGEAVAFCQAREAFGRRLADFQGLQWMLADVATDMEAARQLAQYAARRFEAGEDAVMAAAQAKKFATQVALRRLGDCMQAMGAEGFKTDHPLARHFAAAKMAQYLDGTTEIQNVVIARKLLGG
jgi:alkylation response protein AidB-like acyl-CoA dehydrogenase